MLDKKRFITFPVYTVVFFTCLLFIGCISVWYFNGFPKLTFSFSGDSKYLMILSKNITETNHLYFTQNLSSSDAYTLIDIKTFRFTINHDTCNKTKPYLLMLIHSAPANVEKRNVIRETWGQHMSSIVTFFLVGFSEKYKTELIEENIQYQDLIQGNFLDVYRNMTYKHVMALKWVTYHCSNARYVLKLDDDVYVHVSALVEFLRKDSLPWNSRHFILCDAMLTSKVKRSWRSKWRVSPKEYPRKKYPSYCAGWAILYSTEVVFLLYREAQREPFFWIDDVHVTGTLAKKINITHTPLHSMVLSEHTMKILIKNSSYKRNFFFGPPNLMESGIRSLHNAVTLMKKFNIAID